MKNKLKITGIILAAFLTIIAVVGIIFSVNVGKQVAYGLLYQNEGKDTKENSVRQLGVWAYDLEAFEEAYTARNFEVTAADGNRVPAQLFAGPQSGDYVILVHGLGGDHTAVYPLAEMYLKKGWNVITFDQRASGDSENDLVTFGYFEKLDVQALVEYSRQKLHADRVVVHGQSMGAATAGLYAATEHAAQNLDAVILDSCFDSMKSMFLGVWREMDTEGIPENYVVACGDWYLKRRFGFGFDDVDVTSAMKTCRVKTLMLQMERDEIVPNETAAFLYRNIGAQEKEIRYFDSAHVEGVIDTPEAYGSAVFDFLLK